MMTFAILVNLLPHEDDIDFHDKSDDVLSFQLLIKVKEGLL